MNHLIKYHFCCSCRGVALIELALVLPLLLFLFSAGIEFSNVLRVQEKMNAVTREMAISLYRECRQSISLSSCAPLKATAMHTQIAPMLPAVRLAVTWREYDTLQLPPCFVVNGPLYLGSAGGPSRIDPTAPAFDALCQEQGRLVTVEAMIDYNPIFGGMASMFGFGPREFYAVVSI